MNTMTTYTKIRIIIIYNVQIEVIHMLSTLKHDTVSNKTVKKICSYNILHILVCTFNTQYVFYLACNFLASSSILYPYVLFVLCDIIIAKNPPASIA